MIGVQWDDVPGGPISHAGLANETFVRLQLAKRSGGGTGLKSDDDLPLPAVVDGSFMTTSNEWYVSSTSGNDAWSGTMAQPNAAKTDGPFATIAKAAAVVAARSDRATPTVVSVASGTYLQSEKLVLGVKHGGDSDTGRVIWKGIGGAAALSYGIHLDRATTTHRPWTQTTKNRSLWQRSIPRAAIAAGIVPRQLWAAGARLTRARHPNTGSDFTIPLDGALPGNPTGGFRYTNYDLNRAYSNVTAVEVIVYASWSASRHYIRELNTSTSGNLTVTFTANCLNPTTTMYPNSGNRYYIENDETFVDTPGEWHVSQAGVITMMPPGMTDPNDHDFVADRGDALKTGLQLYDEHTTAPTTLLKRFLGGDDVLVLPADELSLSAETFNLSFGLSGIPTGGGGSIFTRGPVPSKHVPGDTSLSVSGGKIIMDFGWECTLTGSTRVDDNKPHAITISYSDKTLTLHLDGKIDGSVTHSLGVQEKADWRLIIGAGLTKGAKITDITYYHTASSPVKFITFENIAVEHVGWGLGRDESADFQSSSFLDSAAVHLHNASDVVLRNVSVRHVGGYSIWVESSSKRVSIEKADIFDVSGGIRVGRGNPLPSEPAGALRTADISIDNSRIVGGALVYRDAAGVLAQNGNVLMLFCTVSYCFYAKSHEFYSGRGEPDPL